MGMTLKDAIKAGAVLSGQCDGKEEKESKEQDLLALRLRKRLRIACASFGQADAELDDANVKTLQGQTGKAALRVVEEINRAAREQKRDGASSSSAANEAPIFGVRDMHTLRLLFGIISNWNLGPLVQQYDDALQACYVRSNDEPKLQEIDDELAEKKEKDKQKLVFLNIRQSLYATMSQCEQLLSDSSPVARILLDVCSLHMIAASLRLGWGPAIPFARNAPDAIAMQGTTLTAAILKRLTTTTCLKLLSGIAHVGNVRNTSSRPLRFVKAATEMLFAAQLLRKDGVMALLRNTFESSDASDRGLMKKLVSVAQLFTTPPPRMPMTVFATAIAPRLLEVIAELPEDPADEKKTQVKPSQQSSSAQKNAACFALARLWEVEPRGVEGVLDTHIYRYIAPQHPEKPIEKEEGALISSELQLSKAIGLLAETVNQSEPSSSFVTGMLVPVLVPLFAIHSFIANAEHRPLVSTIGGKSKASEREQLGELASSLFKTWLRLSDVQSALSMLTPLNKEGIFGLEGKERGALHVVREISGSLAAYIEDDRHGLSVRWRMASDSLSSQTAALERITLDDLKIRLTDEEKSSENPAIPAEMLAALQQNPSPERLAHLLKQSERKDVAAALLVALLDAYALSKQTKAEDQSLLDVLYLQHILQLIELFGSEVLQGQPDKILNFVAFALDDQRAQVRSVSENQEESVALGTGEDMPFIRMQGSPSPLSNLLDVKSNDLKDTEMHQSGAIVDGDPDDDELVETALNLLLSLLEADATMNMNTHSMLKVIAARVDNLSSHSQSSIRSLAKEAGLVLKARQSATAIAHDAKVDQTLLTKRERALQKGRSMYQEGLKLLQDPILPVRAHGLVMLKDLVAFGTTDESQDVLMDPALVFSILDIFIRAVCDDESFLYLNAVKGLAEMGNSGGQTMIRRLIALYVGSDSSWKGGSLTQSEVDKRLRVGEALLQIVQKLDAALAPYTAAIVSPLLACIRGAALPAALRSSMLSILGTCIEACPRAMALEGYALAICDAMMDLLSVEMDPRGVTTQKQLDDALEANAKLPHLRRAALLLLSLLVRGATMQMQASNEAREEASWQDDVPQLSALRLPGGRVLASRDEEAGRSAIGLQSGEDGKVKSEELLFPPTQLSRLERLVGYIGQVDSDALTRHQAEQILQDVETYKLYCIHHNIH